MYLRLDSRVYSSYWNSSEVFFLFLYLACFKSSLDALLFHLSLSAFEEGK